MKYVGTLQYARLLDACKYYEACGFMFIDVPWAVSKEAMDITRPTWAGAETLLYVAGGEELCPVASAEQSFLQMQMDAIAAGQRITGSYCAITPCFRNEPVLDDLHQPYFLKLELISWDKTTSEDLSKMIAGARLFIEHDKAGLWIDVIKNNDPDPISVGQAYDIVTKNVRIELGSYGIRSHPKVGRWLYGTGLAEPRYSYAIEAEAGYKAGPPQESPA